MNVSLTPEIEGWVQEKVESGFYQSASEVMREALRLMRTYENAREEALQDLRAELLIGLHQLENGEGVLGDDAFVESIKSEGRKRRSGK